MTKNARGTDTLVLPKRNEAKGNRAGGSAHFDPMPGALMSWLSQQAEPGSTRVHLVASTDGALGQMIISSYDENDNNLGDRTMKVTTLASLMTT